MSEADDLQTPGPSPVPPTSVQTMPSSEAAPPPAAVRLDLPAPPVSAAAPTAPVFSEDRAGWNALLDGALAILVVLFAFLLASFPARNSDLWLHLAAGRDVFEGTYHLGADPYAHTTEGVPWVNHAWLFDAAAYGLYQFAGGTVLVVVKALFVALLAVLLLRRGQAGPSLWLSAGAAALALLAMAPRLLLQPAIVSYLFLALTLWLLERTRHAPRGEAGRVPWAAYWPLLPLFALWVNLDEWCVLGPLTVALYTLGRFLDRLTGSADAGEDALRPGESRALGLALVGGLAACLLSPHHVRVFALPFPLGVLGSAPALGEDPLLHRLLLSPFQADYFQGPAVRTPAGVAFYVLALFSLLSFVPACIARRGVPWPRALLWLATFALGACYARCIPFFAIVAGPALALNISAWLAYAAGKAGKALDQRPYTPVWGRAVSVVAALLVVAATWPGWMQGPPFGPRQWAVAPDPSLQAAAQRLAQWQAEGQLPAGVRVFNTSPESANYFAWGCPGARGFLDARLGLFTPVAADYVAVRRGLAGRPVEGDPDWRQVLRDHHVDLVVVHEYALGPRADLLRNLLVAPTECPLLYMDGRTAIFGWRDSARQAPASFAGLRYNAVRRAFHPGPADRAPLEWPGREPQPARWWEAFVHSQAHVSADRDEAAAHLLHYRTLAPRDRRMNVALSVLVPAPLVFGNLALPGGGAAGTAARVAQDLALARSPAPAGQGRRRSAAEKLGLAYRSAFLLSRDAGQPALLLLAVRAARRALHADPDDPETHHILGDSYVLLSHNTREGSWGPSLPMLKSIRQIQAVTAFTNALRLKPDLVKARASLAGIYQEMRVYDLASDELKKVLAQMEREGPRRQETEDQFNERLEPLRKEVTRLQKFVAELEDEYVVNAAHLKVANRAELAVRKGLAGKALQLLLESNIAAFGDAGMRLELSLLLATGEVGKFREFNAPEQKTKLGVAQYCLMRTQLGAATGDYLEADKELQVLRGELDKELQKLLDSFGIPSPPTEKLLTDQAKLSVDVARCMLSAAVRRQPLWARMRQIQAGTRSELLVQNLQRKADLTVMRAVLALEAGRTEEAERLLRGVLALYQDKAGTASGIDFPARAAAEQMLDWLTRANE